MIRYRVLILIFSFCCLFVPVSVAWGEREPGVLGPNALEHNVSGPSAPEPAASGSNVSEPTASEPNTSSQTTIARSAVVTGDYVNLRAAANEGAAVITRLMWGRRVTVLEAGDSWTRVRLADGTEGWIYNKYITTKPVTVASRSMIPVIPEMLGFAKSFLGTKYVYGGASPQGFDCSGFTLYIYNKYALQLPHEALLQSGVGEEVPTMDDLLPGDLVFFKTLGSSQVNHVGIYLGNSQFIHASSGHGNVIISALDTGYYNNCYAGGRRMDLSDLF